jgi:hypothetical protein
MVEQPKPKVGQIWVEMDPRAERYIRIESVGVGRRSVGLRTVVWTGKQWADGPRSRMSYADPERFNAKRGGYAIYENTPI